MKGFITGSATISPSCVLLNSARTSSTSCVEIKPLVVAGSSDSLGWTAQARKPNKATNPRAANRTKVKRITSGLLRKFHLAYREERGLSGGTVRASWSAQVGG